MQAVILAAGRGSRMGLLTNHIPKPLIEVCGKPMISRCIESLPPEIKECLIVVGYRGDQIISHLSEQKGDVQIRYVWQTKQDGTGGGLLQARSLLKAKRFLVVHGDNIYSKKNLCEIIRKKELTYAITSEVATENSRTVLFNSKGRLMGWGSVGCGMLRWFGIGAYVLDNNIWSVKLHTSSSGELSIPHSLHYLKRPVMVYKTQNWSSVNTPKELEATVKRIKSTKDFD